MPKAFKTITYVVYPPNYIPALMQYHKVDTKQKAFRLAVRLGNGSEIHQNIRSLSNHEAGTFFATLDTWEVVHQYYLIQVMRRGRYIRITDTTQRICDKYGKYSPVYRQPRK